MKAQVAHENGTPGIAVALEILGQSEDRQLLRDNEQTIAEATGELGHFWGRCCQEIAPWLLDCGVSEIEILVPVMPSDMSPRSEEHTSELQSLMRTSYAVFCLKKKKTH